MATGCTKDNGTIVDPAPEPINETVSGDVSGTWAKGGTYTVKNHLQIPAGKSLVIEEGVKVIFADSTVKPELIVKGNLYMLGTAANPVKLTVPDTYKTAANQWGRLWGGIICAPTCEELLLEYAEIEYGGATTTEESPSVKAGLYKATAGEGVPAINFTNVNGKVVMQHSRLNNFAEDGLYFEGGKVIVTDNLFYTIGQNGGDAINMKSGVVADVAFNVIFGPNTNAIKLSNAGDRSPQIYVKAYNNTMVNAGWRRPTVKGGSIWVEASARADVINNLFLNDRFGVKRDTKKPEDERTKVSNNFYYGYTQAGVDQFQPSTEILKGTDDILSTKAGNNDPKLANFALETPGTSTTYNTGWDFTPLAGSPLLGKGKADFVPHYKEGGLTLNGKSYTSPASASYIGAKAGK